MSANTPLMGFGRHRKRVAPVDLNWLICRREAWDREEFYSFSALAHVPNIGFHQREREKS